MTFPGSTEWVEVSCSVLLEEWRAFQLDRGLHFPCNQNLGKKLYLYLDVDGVLNPYPRMGKMGDFPDYANVKIRTTESGDGREMNLRLSEKMGEELFNLGIEIVWSTTWCAHPAGLQEIAKRVGLEHCRALPIEPYDEDMTGPNGQLMAEWEHYRREKLFKMLEDVRKHKLPFIWCDDEAIDGFAIRYLRGAQNLPDYLTIDPDSKTGLIKDEIEIIRSFIRQQI